MKKIIPVSQNMIIFSFLFFFYGQHIRPHTYSANQSTTNQKKADLKGGS